MTSNQESFAYALGFYTTVAVALQIALLSQLPKRALECAYLATADVHTHSVST